MYDWFQAVPGRLYVAGTLLPLAAFVVLLTMGGLRALYRPFRKQGGFAAAVYWAFGGDTPGRAGAYLATVCMGVTAALGVTGLVLFLNDHTTGADRAARWGERLDWVRIGPLDSSAPPVWEKRRDADPSRGTPPTALALELGYKIDHLTAVVFAMVTVIGTLIFVFSIGYMREETQETVEDHAVAVQGPSPIPSPRGAHKTEDPSPTPPTLFSGPVSGASRGPERGEGLKTEDASLAPPSLLGKGAGGLGSSDPSPRGEGLQTDDASVGEGAGALGSAHLRRRGRFGRFFLYLSLFCFSMLNLVIADNLFQVFVSWELVGVCSFFLIGFYYERPSASRAANKAFIVNRVGDAGFLVGILIAWTYLGTLNFEEMNRRVRSPERDSHGRLALGHQLVRVVPAKEPDEQGNPRYELPPKDQFGTGSDLVLFPLGWENPHHYDALGYGGHRQEPRGVPARTTYTDFGVIPYWLFVVMGIGIFLGCAGKSAQVPLQTWLPDAMEGPTPVSALIHAATMVAAGVYLVGRCYPLFAPEVLLTIAYTGAVTLFISATIALVQTDIKRVLAFSTCSQLGFMMLALGVGGWVAGLLHLVTHAFFKALLFLCSGSVIHGCHHEQDLRKMGGLRSKMPVTALTMLVGVLAISGAPLLSGWYSKDMILSSALAYVTVNPAHALLFALPIVTAGLTAYYMFRLWFLAFTGAPRDHHVSDHAHESPLVMTLPLIALAAFSVVVAWGWPLWDAEASALGHVLEKGQPPSVGATFYWERDKLAHDHAIHLYAGVGALVVAVVGAGTAFAVFYRKQPGAALYATGPAWYRFLLRKWYFDEVYDATLVKPTLTLAHAAAAADRRPTGAPHGAEARARRFDFFTLDGVLNAVGQVAGAFGDVLRRAQTGRVRSYVLVLALTAAGMLGMLAFLSR